MAEIDLIFKGAPVTELPAALVFGEDDAPVIPPVTLQGGVQLSGLRIRVGVRVGVRLQAAIGLTGLRIGVSAVYDINVSRPTVGQVFSRWQDAGRTQSGLQGFYQQAEPLSSGAQSRWHDAAALSAFLSAHWQETKRLAIAVRELYQDAIQLPVLPLAQRYQESRRLRSGGVQLYQEAIRLGVSAVRVRYEGAQRARAGIGARYQEARPSNITLAIGMGVAVPIYASLGGRYQEAWPPRPGRWVGPVVPLGPDPCYVPSLPSQLVFSQASVASMPAPLAFVCERHGPGPGPGATVVVPIRRVYMSINNVTLVRVETGEQLRAHGFSMSLDYQSWTWSWSASLHQDAAPHLGRDSQGDPPELAVFVNGQEFRVRLERISRDRRFNPTRWAVGGRGKAAILDQPWAPVMNFANASSRTAQQLTADALTINGVSIGWAVDWNLTDWVVPDGAWALQGAYIDAINDIASAAGGYVQPHATDAVLRVLHRYPEAPWNWGDVTPDFEIPAAAAEIEGTDYVDKPAYNRVFVGGVSAGVFGPFKRAGTAGDVLAPQVTHPLITHADAHRQRGLTELADTGRQEHVSLKMQVLPETGIIVPGQFVRYVGEKTVVGIVRSTAIEWSRPVLRQTIGIETHA